MKYLIELTLSKILAYVIFLIGALYSFVNKDAATLITLAGISAGLIVNKQVQDRMKESK